VNKGEKFEYFWLESTNVIWKLKQPIIEHHIGHQLYLLTIDDAGAMAGDWVIEKNIVVDPLLSWYQYYELTPYEYNEWFILKDPLQFPEHYEMMVAYDGFTLAPPEYTYKDLDPNWESNPKWRGILHWLLPLQERFWPQLKRLNPETYLGHGYYDLIVSKNKKFMTDSMPRLSNYKWITSGVM
jgi:hypothetical protein